MQKVGDMIFEGAWAFLKRQYSTIGYISIVVAIIIAVVVGVPARRVGWMCRCGERLAFADGRGVCAACGTPYEETATGIRPIDPGAAAI